MSTMGIFQIQIKDSIDIIYLVAYVDAHLKDVTIYDTDGENPIFFTKETFKSFSLRLSEDVNVREKYKNYLHNEIVKNTFGAIENISEYLIQAYRSCILDLKKTLPDKEYSESHLNQLAISIVIVFASNIMQEIIGKDGSISAYEFSQKIMSHIVNGSVSYKEKILH